MNKKSQKINSNVIINMETLLKCYKQLKKENEKLKEENKRQKDLIRMLEYNVSELLDKKKVK